MRAARWAVEGLTDAEYFWEPVDRCWTVHRRDDDRGVHAQGRGEWVIDYDLERPPYVSTIAWRMNHISACNAVYRDHAFGDATLGWDDLEIPGTPADAVAWLDQTHAQLRSDLATLTPDDAFSERRAWWGAPLTVRAVLWTLTVEHVHHGAEIGVLRDILRGRPRTDLFPEDQGP